MLLASVLYLYARTREAPTVGAVLAGKFLKMGEYWIDAVIGLVTGAAGWIAGSRMRKAQTSSIEFENYRAFVETNNRIIESLRVQVTDLIKENSELRAKVDHLEDEVRTIRRTYPCDNCPKL